MAEDFFAVGRVLAPWGIRGEVKVAVFSDYPNRFAPQSRVFIDAVPQTIERSRRVSGGIIVKLAHINTRNQAELVRGRLLEVPESGLMPLEPGQYFHHQIVGLQVTTTEGRTLGKVVDILRTGSNDVYVVQQDGKEHLIPAIAEVVKEVDLAGSRLLIEPLPGLLE